MAGADDPAAAAAAASSSAGDEDDEGTDTDASNSDRAAPQDQDPDRQLLADNAAPAPSPPAAAAAPEPTGAVAPRPQPAAATDDSRRLFQRLWTDEEELLILRGFLDFTARRGTTFASHQYDTGPFYEEIRRRLSFDFSKSQLIEKLRRLKKKYRVCAARMAAQGAAFAFRSAHEGAIYDVARHIWRPAVRRDGGQGGGGDASDEDDINPAAATAASAALPGVVDDGAGGSASAHTPRAKGGRRVRRKTAEELEPQALPTTTSPLILNDVARQPLVVAVDNLTPTNSQLPVLAPSPAPAASGATEEAVRAILSPLLRELVSSVTVAGQTGLGLGLNMGFGGIGGVDILGPGLGGGVSVHGSSGDEKWRRQQILELEVYLKRIELVREQVAAALEELRSSEG